MEAFGKDVDKEATDELRCGQTHDLLTITVFDPVIFPAESHGIGIRTDQPMVGDRDPVGIAAQIGEDRLRPCERRLGINHPLSFAERGEPERNVIGLRQAIEIAKEGELACAVQFHESFQEQTSEQPCQHPHMEKEPGLTGHPFCAVR